MRKLIAALVLGVMACSSANAMKTYEWVDEEGILRFQTVMEPDDVRVHSYRASSEPSKPVSKKRNIRISHNGSTTIVEDSNSGEYMMCSQDPYDKSLNCQ